MDTDTDNISISFQDNGTGSYRVYIVFNEMNVKYTATINVDINIDNANALIKTTSVLQTKKNKLRKIYETPATVTFVKSKTDEDILFRYGQHFLEWVLPHLRKELVEDAIPYINSLTQFFKLSKEDNLSSLFKELGEMINHM